MHRLLLSVLAFTCLAGFIAAEPNTAPTYFYPVEHRSDLKVLQEQAALQGYNLQIVRRDTDSDSDDSDDDVQYDPVTSLSIPSMILSLLPAPLVAVKAVVGKVFGLILKVTKLFIPVGLIVLGMGLFLGFCAFTPYCTLIIEEPIASKIRALRGYIPYVDDIEYYVYDAFDRVQAMQG